MAGVRIEFAQFGDFDSFTIYRSNTPIDIGNMPAPIAAGLTTMCYVDGTIAEQQSYYYRVGVVRDEVELLSDEIQYIPVPIASEIPTDYILAYEFNGDVLDKSTNALNGIKSGTANFVEGRKNGTQALGFVSGCVKTPQVLPINSDKLTVSFWMNTSNNDTSFIYELSPNYGAYGNAFVCYIEASDPNKLRSYVGVSGNNNAVSAPITKNGVWQHVIIEIDRSRDIANEQKIYINNAPSNLTFIYSANTSGNFGDYIFYIGQRNASNFPYVGKLQDFKIYNRVLTDDERTALFNE